MSQLRSQFLQDLDRARLQSDIIYAYRRITGKKPYKYQEEYLLSTARLNVVLKSRQTGFTFAAAFKKFWLTWTGRSEDEIIVSVSKRASDTVMRYIKAFAHKAGETPASTQVWNNDQITWKNGCNIFSLPQAPSTIRSLHGNVLLDECAHYEHGKDVLESVLPFLSRGYGLDAISTPAGMDEVFYHGFWLNEHYNKFTVPWHLCPDLTEENLKPIWDSMDEESIRQEYNCEFLDEAHSYFSYDLIKGCTDSNLVNLAKTESGRVCPPNAVYLGIDIGRKVDATEFIFLDALGVQCGRVSMKNTPFSEQLAFARECMERVLRICIDATGIGMNLAESLTNEFGSRVVAVTFTNQIKEMLMTNLHVAFEKRPDGKRITIINDRDLINQLHAMKRLPTASGIRFDVDDSEKHHGDAAWALALAWCAGFIVNNTPQVMEGNGAFDYL